MFESKPPEAPLAKTLGDRTAWPMDELLLAWLHNPPGSGGPPRVLAAPPSGFWDAPRSGPACPPGSLPRPLCSELELQCPAWGHYLLTLPPGVDEADSAVFLRVKGDVPLLGFEKRVDVARFLPLAWLHNLPLRSAGPPFSLGPPLCPPRHGEPTAH